MKYIEVIDTAYAEKLDTNLTFIIVVDDDEFELLKSDLDHILSNQNDYDNVYEEMMDCIEEHGASVIKPDFSMDW